MSPRAAICATVCICVDSLCGSHGVDLVGEDSDIDCASDSELLHVSFRMNFMMVAGISSLVVVDVISLNHYNDSSWSSIWRNNACSVCLSAGEFHIAFSLGV